MEDDGGLTASLEQALMSAEKGFSPSAGVAVPERSWNVYAMLAGGVW